MENMTNNIQKPISLVMEEAKKTIIDAINGVQLHPTLLEMIMKDIYVEIQEHVKVTTEREMQEYNRALALEAVKKAKEANGMNENVDIVSDVD